MTKDLVGLRALHNDLLSGRFTGNKYELLHTFGNSAFLEARSTVESFLNDSDPQLRYISLNVLVLHWSLQEYRETSLRMLETDPDSDVRRLAATCVGTLFAESKSPEALRALLAIISADEEWDVRDAAYVALLETIGVP